MIKNHNINNLLNFSSNYAVLMSKNKDQLAWNQNNVYERSYMSTHQLLFQWASTPN